MIRGRDPFIGGAARDVVGAEEAPVLAEKTGVHLPWRGPRAAEPVVTCP